MLLKNGHLIDPTTKIDTIMDIRVENGIITELGQNLASQNEEKVLDTRTY